MLWLHRHLPDRRCWLIPLWDFSPPLYAINPLARCPSTLNVWMSWTKASQPAVWSCFFPDGMQKLLKGAQLVLCHCWLGVFSPDIYFDSWTSQELELQVPWPRCFSHDWLWHSDLFWTLVFKIPQVLAHLKETHACLDSPYDFWCEYLQPTLLPSLPPHSPPMLTTFPETLFPGCIRTDPKSVPFLDMAKYSPVLTDLMATTPTLTDRISIRPERQKRGQESGLETLKAWEIPH